MGEFIESVKSVSRMAGGIFLSFGAIVSIKYVNNYFAQFSPQTRDVIGSPDARDPNEVYMVKDGVKYYAVVDGNSVEDLVERGNRK